MPTAKEGLFSPKLVADLINKVQGESALASLSGARPIPFNGTKEFTFNLDNEIDVVAEAGKKTEGGLSLDPVIIQPIKIEYGARVSDEFVNATEEERINFIQGFNEGFARKLAKGFDIMALLGINPRTGSETSVIGDNAFIKQAADLEDANVNADQAIENAINQVQKGDKTVTGTIFNRDVATELAKVTVDGQGNGIKRYPELAWGASPSSLNGRQIRITNNISFADSKTAVLTGDFANAFRWGFAKQIPVRAIEYGDPDNSGKDLQGYNQVYLRAEAYLGWGILDKDAFVKIDEDAIVPVKYKKEENNQSEGRNS